MKTYDKLFPKINNFDNLLKSARLARKGKKMSTEMARFHFNLENELLHLHEELTLHTYQPGAYKTFQIYDPKERMISAAPYRDRVVHHALCQVIEPIFDRTFIYDTYANRLGKGTHQAIERYQYYAQRYPYVLKCDIRKFFASIDHQILKEKLRWKIRCKDTLWLIDSIIDASNPQEPHLIYFPGDDLFSPQERKRGLPIGNLTSQFWGNVYLNRFDHFIKEELGVPGYIRYVDDFVLFATSNEELREWKRVIKEKLAELRLVPHPGKTRIYQVKDGVPFLGFTVFPQYRYVRKQNSKRHFRHLRKMVLLKEAGKRSPQQLEDSLNSWLGHLRFGQSKRTEYKRFWYLRNHGVNLHVHPRGSWRVLEQQ